MGLYSRFLVALFSDTHGGQTLGLMNPETVLEDFMPDGEPIMAHVTPNPANDYLWDLYETHVQQLAELADGDEIVVIHNGDLTQGRKYFDSVLYSSIPAQMAIAEYNMMPLLDLPNVNVFRFSFGTPSHIFYQGASTIMTKRVLKQRYPDKDIEAVRHGLLDLNGFTIDFAHHGPSGGIRAWLKGNQFRYYLKSLMFDELKAGRRPPDLIMRSHFHVKIREAVFDTFHPYGDVEINGVITPSYTLMNDYAQMATRSQPRVTNGMGVAEIINGTMHKMHWFTKTSDLRTEESPFSTNDNEEPEVPQVVIG